MTLLVPAEPPLVPSPDEGRSLLRRELLEADYREDDVLGRLLDWVRRLIVRTLDAASSAPPLSTFFAMLVGLLLVLALVWLVTRTRASRGVRRQRAAAVPDDIGGRGRVARACRGGVLLRGPLRPPWSTASGPWPCARWSEDCWTTPPGRPPTSWPSPSAPGTPTVRSTSTRGPGSSTSSCTATAWPPQDQARSVLALDDELAGTA